VAFDHQRSQSETIQTFQLHDEQPWLQNSTATPILNDNATCTDGCVSTVLNTTIEASQPDSLFDGFGWYPFDSHNATFRFGVSDAVFNCSDVLVAISDADLESRVQPTNGEWRLATTQPVVVRNVIDKITMQPLPYKCELPVRVVRTYTVQLVKSLALSMMTVLACLLANFMHPADHSGDRTAIVLVAALILTANVQADQGLGKINYLIWLDGFNLLLFMITVLSLIQTMVVHRLYFYVHDVALALNLDLVCNLVLIIVLFPSITYGYVLTAFNGPAALFYVGGPLLSICIIPLAVWRMQCARAQSEARLIRDAVDAKRDDPMRDEKLQRAFGIFDRDQSGCLHAVEFQQLLRALNPKVAPGRVHAAYREVAKTHFVRGKLPHDEFLIAITDVDNFLLHGSTNPAQSL